MSNLNWFDTPLLTWGGRAPVVLQTEAAECGLACLAVIAGYHRKRLSLGQLRRLMEVSSRGTTLAELIQFAARLDFGARALRLEPIDLGQINLPCILHWDMDHFVVLEKLTKRGARIIDPSIGRRQVSMRELSGHFTGVALELVPLDSFEEEKVRTELRFSSFFNGVRGVRRAAVKLISLSLALQTVGLALPFFSQLVIDEVVPSQDWGLLTLLVVVFSLLAVLEVAVASLRAFLMIYFGAHLQFSWAGRVLHHLLRLPLNYFEKRHLGDIQSRFRSVAAVQDLATNTVLEVFIDGIMGIAIAAVMLAYSVKLALVSLAAVFVYALIRRVLYAYQRDAEMASIVEKARQSSHLLETLRGIMTIKCYAREANRESAWLTKTSRAIRSSAVAEAYDAGQRLVSRLIFSLQGIFVVALAAHQVIEGGFSIGMLVAFLAYQGQFSSRTLGLVDKFLQFRLLSVHLDRIADIVLSESERGYEEPIGRKVVPTAGQISAKNISYRYTIGSPYVFQNLSINVEAGQCLAIFSPSGSGKTTLIKVMMGLLEPSSGAVLVDGNDISQCDLRSYRSRVASVMQEDSLLAGSLAENISFFHERPDYSRIEECAKAAAIHDEIVAMPMGYATLVGDMGTVLSGGQKQRVLLARALYARPRILFLDEATCHVDGEREEEIHHSLGRLRMTRILITHRRETLKIADQVVNMNELQEK
ncbi:peptidase domain-containing ABC transporter [Abyssibacter sp.]|uniref:peptidase domain-containing ABC transporter n=1 Tax=Abyssibacter sp. TaxID=2320200 RepID=UPI0035149B2B